MNHLFEVLASEALEPNIARDEIAQRLAAAIVDGRLPEGTPIRQQRLANHYNVSRMPVREALRQLESQGLLISDEHRGMRVAALTPIASGADHDDLAALLIQTLPFLTNSPDLVQHGAEELAAKIKQAFAVKPQPKAGLSSQDACLNESEPKHDLILKRFTTTL